MLDWGTESVMESFLYILLRRHPQGSYGGHIHAVSTLLHYQAGFPQNRF